MASVRALIIRRVLRVLSHQPYIQPPSPLLFLASGDLFSLRENLASATASVLFPGSWPFPKKRNVGQHSG